MLELEGIKNIIFDFGGVIINLDYQRTSSAFKRIGFHHFDEFYSKKSQVDIFDKFETGRISEKDFLDGLNQEVPQASELELADAWNAMLLDLPKDRLDLLRMLGKHYRIFLLSNTNSIHERAFLKEMKRVYGSDLLLEEIFEEVYMSHKINKRKPNADCFEYVLERHNLLAAETLFIDDSIQHVLGAEKVGLKTYHLKDMDTILGLFPDKVL